MTKTTSIILTTLLVVAHAIELTYTVGKTSAPYIKMAVALTITMVLYLIDGVKFVYTNRQSILDTVGAPFVYTYEAPVVLKAPKRIRFRRPANTLAMA